MPRFGQYRVRMEIFDGEKRVGASEEKVSYGGGWNIRDMPPANSARIKCELPEVNLWSPETPKLYTAVFTLISPEGEDADFEGCKTGFKKIEVKNGVVYLNGGRLVVFGVNRHQHHYKTGRFVPVDWMRREITEMKRMNINAVRTCHYPDPSEWYELCDELGILLVCECNIETHGIGGQP